VAGGTQKWASGSARGGLARARALHGGGAAVLEIMKRWMVRMTLGLLALLALALVCGASYEALASRPSFPLST
jgi:hypothetical protein